MKRTATLAFLLGCVFATPTYAALNLGDTAPAFTAKATLGGEEFSFDMAEALKKGPVVLYFFPKAFTTGCTAEAHDFAEAAIHFKEAGATLIGMSADGIGTLKKFSVQECGSKFPVAADPDLNVTKLYDATLVRVGSTGLSDRISYVISPEGKVAYVYADRNPDKHVENTLAAVKALKK